MAAVSHRYSIFPGCRLPLLLPAPIVVAADYLSVDEAQKAVFPDADAFQEIFVAQNPDAAAGDAGARRPAADPRHDPHLEATRDGALLGHVFIDEVIGRQNLITYAVGIDADGAAPQSRNHVPIARAMAARSAIPPGAPSSIAGPARSIAFSDRHQEHFRRDALFGARHRRRSLAHGAVAIDAAAGRRAG